MVSREHFDIALDVLADMYNAPLFEPDEIERERGVILEELAMTYDQPDSLADLLIDHALWPDQPMGRDVGGTRESVGGITREQLAAYHARQYVPSNTVVAVAGNIEHHEVVESVAALLGDGQAGETLTMHPVRPDGDGGVRVRVSNRKTDQAHLCLAVDGPAADSEDRYAVDMMNTVLGEGMSSRLFVELRERRGLAYDVHSSAMHYRDCGALLVTCGVDTANATEAVQAVLREWDGVQQGVTEEELSRACEYAVGRLGLRLEDTRAVMGWMGGQELLRNEVLTPEEVVDSIRAITTDDVTAAAQRYFGTGAYRLSAVGPFRSQARFEKLLAA